MRNSLEKHCDLPIILIGFMGVGKTTVGEALKKKTNYELIDVDQVIEESFGLSTSAIFEKYGEAFFRTKEQDIIEKLLEDEKKILSLGGGAFLNETTRKNCLKKGVVVHLSMSWDVWKTRIPLIYDTRPLLHNRTEEEIHDLYFKRLNVYKECHIAIEADHLTPEEISEKILNKIKNPGGITYE